MNEKTLFSDKNLEVRENFVMKHSSMFYSALSYQAYTLVTQPTGGFHPAFYAHLLSINDAIQKNLTRKARYLSELAIRMYGNSRRDDRGCRGVRRANGLRR